MRVKSSLILLAALTAGFLFFLSCNKKEDAPGSYTLSYGGQVIYLANQSGDHVVYPAEARAGVYTAFPEGIELDENTGAINVSKSETGLRYRITHTAPNGDTTSVIVLLSGITFTDKFYNLSQNDSIAFPVYNGDAGNPLPIAGSVFDEGDGANTGGCSVKTTNGQINLSESVRNGVFGSTPRNDVRRDFDILYRLNDESGKALNRLRVRMYWYNTMADVPADLWEILNDRQSQGVFLQANNSNFTGPGTARSAGTSAVARPRPPCIILIGQ